MNRSFDNYNSEEFLIWFARENVKCTWEYVEHLLSDDEVFGDYKFHSMGGDNRIVIVYVAGDRVHPELGYDFLGPDWEKMDEQNLFRLLGQRDEATQEVFERFLSILESSGYDEALKYAESGTKYKVLYVSRSREETHKCIQEMIERGLGRNELSCGFTEIRNGMLVIASQENISYYELGET